MSSPPFPREPLALPANLNLAAAEALAPLLRDAALAEAGPVRVDASQVSAVGQAILQLLLATARSAAGLRMTAASDAFAERVGQLGLKELAA